MAETENRNLKKEILRLVAGAVLFTSYLISSRIAGISVITYCILALSYLILGYKVIYEAFCGLFHGQVTDENFLMTVATAGAIFLGEYSEAVAVMLFYCIGEFLQDIAENRSRNNIAKLMDIAPRTVRLIDGTKELIVEPQKLKKGDVFKVLAGERIAVDGIVISGSAWVDTKAVTGESVPVPVKKGDSVISGCIVTDSTLTVMSSTEYEDSTVNRILKLIEESKESKASPERFITRFSKIYTPIVIAFAFLIAVIPSLIAGSPAVWIHRSLCFLVISCPCALVLSVPLAFFAGIGGGAVNGILIKGGSELQQLAVCRIIAIDKTGTLTKGEFRVTGVTGLSDYSLSLAASLENSSCHPLAKAVVGYVKDFPECSEVTEISGMGMKGIVDGHKVLAGNYRLMSENDIAYDDSGKTPTVIHVACDGIYCGYITVEDTVKAEAKNAVTELKKHGFRTVMLTGDVKTSAESVSKQTGIDEYRYSLLPQDKVEAMKELCKIGKTAYTGDGINDAPVLAYADAGIAMGSLGSASAVDAAGIVIMNDDLMKIPQAVNIAKKTMQISKQNIVFAIAIKITCMVLGFFGLVGMPVAVFADTGAAILTVLNSCRALKTKQSLL